MERLLDRFRSYPADAITPADIEGFLEDGSEPRKNRGKNWKPSTINHYRSLLSLTYRLAIRNGKATHNPARATRHRKEDNTRVRYLSAEEESKLRKVLERDWPAHLPEFDLALHTGLRLSEMYALDWRNIDLNQRFLLVQRGKNGESRYARLNSVALKALDELKKRSNGAGPVIRNLAGEPLSGPRYWFEKALTDAEIAGFHWHDLRHTFASRLAMAGVGIRAIQDALGHKSIAMTVRYSHLAPDFLLNVVEKLVPKEIETDTEEPSDTSTDTGIIQPQPMQAAHVQ